MWWDLIQATTDAISGWWGGHPEADTPTQITAPPPDPEPPCPWSGQWGRDPDVFEEVCRLQELWCKSDGIDRYWAGRRYREAVGRLFRNAA